MTVSLASSGQNVGLRIPGFCDTFAGADETYIDYSNWIDFKDLYPNSYSRAILNGAGCVTTRETVYPRDPNTDLVTPGSTQRVGHLVICRAMGSTNGQLTVDVYLPEALQFYHQVGPAFGIDITGEADPLKLGVCHNWDISLSFTAGYSYAQNVFMSSDLAYSYDPTLYYRVQGDKVSTQGDTVLVDGDPVPGTGATFRGTWSSGTAYSAMDIVEQGSNSYRCLQAHTNQPLPATPTKGFTPDTAYWSHLTTRRWSATGAEAAANYNEGPFPPGVGQNGETDLNFDNYPTTMRYTVRVVDGWYQTWCDEKKLHNPTPMPSWAIGRDGWGIHVINTIYDPGTSFPFGTYPMNDINFRVSKILWQPYDTPLV